MQNDTQNMVSDHSTRQRLLECWLPFTQESNQRNAWGYDAAMLEALTLVSAEALAETGNTAEARIVLALYHSWYQRLLQ